MADALLSEIILRIAEQIKRHPRIAASLFAIFVVIPLAGSMLNYLNDKVEASKGPDAATVNRIMAGVPQLKLPDGMHWQKQASDYNSEYQTYVAYRVVYDDSRSDRIVVRQQVFRALQNQGCGFDGCGGRNLGFQTSNDPNGVVLDFYVLTQ